MNISIHLSLPSLLPSCLFRLIKLLSSSSSPTTSSRRYTNRNQPRVSRDLNREILNLTSSWRTRGAPTNRKGSRSCTYTHTHTHTHTRLTTHPIIGSRAHTKQQPHTHTRCECAWLCHHQASSLTHFLIVAGLTHRRANAQDLAEEEAESAVVQINPRDILQGLRSMSSHSDILLGSAVCRNLQCVVACPEAPRKFGGT